MSGGLPTYGRGQPAHRPLPPVRQWALYIEENKGAGEGCGSRTTPLAKGGFHTLQEGSES